MYSTNKAKDVMIVLVPGLISAALIVRAWYTSSKNTVPVDPQFPIRLKLTYYYVHKAKAGNIPILDSTGGTIALVSYDSYKNMVLEGTGRLPDGRLANVTMDTTQHPTFGKLYVFKIVRAATGASGKELTPFESVAVDRKVFPMGTKLSLKELNRIVVAEDTGGAIKGNHIDYFIGEEGNKIGLKLPGYVNAVVVS
jgi:hypothetical protein